MKASTRVASTLLVTVLAACGGNGSFSGSNKAVSVPQATSQDNQDKTDTTATNDGTNVVTTTTVSTTDNTVPAVCTAKLDYNPTDIKCALKESASNTIWKNSAPSWSARVQAFTNKDAFWLSPLAAAKTGANYDYCPYVPGSDKLIFVSHFELAADATVKLEAIIDDQGSVRLWKDANSKTVAYSSPAVTAAASDEVALTKGFYSVIIDGIDTGATATGMIASFTDKATGALIRQTESTKDWCIYRVTKDTNVEDFINSAALCQPCMRGVLPN